MSKSTLNITYKGFTLIELLVIMGILGLLGAGFLGLQYVFSQNQVVAWRNYLNIEESNSSLAQIVKELRSCQQGANGEYPIEVASDQEIIFYSDTDFDEEVERVRYTLSATNLIKGIINPTSGPVFYPPGEEKVKVLSENVRNGSDPIFYYYNSNWPGDTTNNPLVPADRIAQTRLIKIILRLNNKANNPESDYILESDTRLRQLNGI